MYVCVRLVVLILWFTLLCLFRIFTLHVSFALSKPLVVGLTKKKIVLLIKTTILFAIRIFITIVILAENEHNLTSRSALAAGSEQNRHTSSAQYIRIISEETMETNNRFVRERLSIFERRAGSLFRKAVACCTGYEEYDDLDEKARPVLQIGHPTNFRHEKINIPGLEAYGYRADSPSDYGDMEKTSRQPSCALPGAWNNSQYSWPSDNDFAPPYRDEPPTALPPMPSMRSKSKRYSGSTPCLTRINTLNWSLEEFERCSLRSGVYGQSEKWREDLLTKLRLVGTR